MFISSELIDSDLILKLKEILTESPDDIPVLTYKFLMISNENLEMGGINLRIGNTNDLELYRGHVGYTVLPEFRGRHYASRSLKLILPVAGQLGINPVWITCNPDNIASRRTCQIAGAEFVDIVRLPPEHYLYKRGEREKCRYRIFP